MLKALKLLYTLSGITRTKVLIYILYALKNLLQTNILLKNANKSIDPLGENAFGHLVVIPF